MKMNKTLLQQLASTIQAYHNCVKSGNTEWQEKHAAKIESLTKNLPHGSGIDGNTSVNLNKSDGKSKIVIDSEFHYMDGNGFYAGWVRFQITLYANLDGYPDIKFSITYNSTLETKAFLENMLGDYLIDSFSYALTQES